MGSASLLFVFGAATVQPAFAAEADAGAQTKYELVDRVMATVNKDVITLSDLERQARVLLVLRSGPQALSGMGDPSFTSSVLDYLVKQLLIMQDMRKQGNWTQGIGDDAVAPDVKQFAAKFGSEEAYQSFLGLSGLSEEGLRDLLLKDKRVDKYLAEKTRSAADVSDDDAEEYYRRNQSVFSGLTFEQAEPNIKAVIGKQRSEKFVKEYIDELKSKYEIRFLAVPR